MNSDQEVTVSWEQHRSGSREPGRPHRHVHSEGLKSDSIPSSPLREERVILTHLFCFLAGHKSYCSLPLVRQF